MIRVLIFNMIFQTVSIPFAYAVCQYYFFSPAIYKEQKATLLQRLEDIKSKLK